MVGSSVIRIFVASRPSLEAQVSSTCNRDHPKAREYVIVPIDVVKNIVGIELRNQEVPVAAAPAGKLSDSFTLFPGLMCTVLAGEAVNSVASPGSDLFEGTIRR